mmetsp:Transcript_711/g.1837  ORF Transcript_711/g.1837 Transcript_711/m.1837 type:complete len:210 (-) Transcript_711:153-782(-)
MRAMVGMYERPTLPDRSGSAFLTLRDVPKCGAVIPGRCRQWLTSSTTGKCSCVARSSASPTGSTTSRSYPNENPRSQRMTRVFGTDSAVSVAAILYAALITTAGDANWPFFTSTTRCVRAACASKSVCRHRNAGICSTSATSAARNTVSSSCTSVSTGSPVLALTASNARNPVSIPAPRYAPGAERFALSNDALNTTESSTSAAAARTA